METMLIEIAYADIHSRSIQVRCDHRDVTERSMVLFKAEAANKLRKVGVITVVEHGVIRAAPIQLNDIVDLRPQLALGEFPRAHTADLFLFTKRIWHRHSRISSKIIYTPARSSPPIP